MDGNSRRRRTAGRRRPRTAGRSAWSGRPRAQQPTPDDPGPPLEALVQAAMWSWLDDPPVHAELLDVLDARAGRGDPVLATAQRMLDDALDGLWRRGWTPADVAHVATRRLSAAQAAVATAAVIADGRSRARAGQPLHPRWHDQLDMLAARSAARTARGVSALRCTVTVLGLLARLQDQPRTMPGPGQESAPTPAGVSRLDQRMLTRVRALLAKAESTEFDEEAEALTAKAQELIARHAIAEALLRTPGDIGEPSVRRVFIDDPYADAKAALLSQIADANRCRTVFDPSCGWVTVFGYDSDLDAVELLAASLLTQATSAMVRHGTRRGTDGRSTTRSFRRAFLHGFGHRIGERLRTATDGQVAAAAPSEQGRLLPVLAARDERLRAAQDAAFPNTTRRSASVSNPGGWVAGQAAADQANLDVPTGRLPDASPGRPRNAP
jgi:hypothetical protein